MLPLKCCLDHSYELALYTDFFSVWISQNGTKMSHLCSMITAQKKANDCVKKKKNSLAVLETKDILHG